MSIDASLQKDRKEGAPIDPQREELGPWIELTRWVSAWSSLPAPAQQTIGTLPDAQPEQCSGDLGSGPAPGASSHALVRRE
jgi:hypothetical protein